jgi:hypothetical protein
LKTRQCLSNATIYSSITSFPLDRTLNFIFLANHRKLSISSSCELYLLEDDSERSKKKENEEEKNTEISA